MARVKTFDYEKSNGSVSKRIVWEIAPHSNKMFAIDLTEFDEEDRAQMISGLDALWQEFSEGVKGLGLKNNYRYFINKGILR